MYMDTSMRGIAGDAARRNMLSCDEAIGEAVPSILAPFAASGPLQFGWHSVDIVSAKEDAQRCTMHCCTLWKGLAASKEAF